MAKFKQSLDEKTVALTLGILSALLHFIGDIILFVGGEGVIKWFNAIHFISKPVQVLPFEPVNFVVGIVGAFIVGAVIGWLFAVIWNWIVRR